MKYIVAWEKWNKTKPISKFQICNTELKANRLKNNLEKQAKFIDVYIAKII